MRYIVRPGMRGAQINAEIYGNFSEHLGRCIYGGVFVGRDSEIPNVNGMRTDVVEALRKLALPVLRWPGGCFADEYHWMDGIGPLETRKRMYNSHWGGVVEDNSFGTHEFFELCRQIGCKPYVNGNVGSGSVREMQEWVEYMTSPAVSPMADLRRRNGQDAPWTLPYFAVGNENWGCGGNMTPEYYADEYRRYQTYVRRYGDERVYKIACGPGCSKGDPGYEWTKVLMEKAARQMDGLSLHYYTVPAEWSNKGSATEFDLQTYLNTIARAYFMETLVKNHGAIMDFYDPEKRVGLIVDEWGTWFDVEPGTNPGFLYQQNTMRDAMVAGLTLNIFNRHADRVKMANIAQLANVLQAVVLTEGKRMLLTPTYHVFEMMKAHQNAVLVSSAIETNTFTANDIETPVVSESASVSGDGSLNVTLVNTSPDAPAQIEMRVDGALVNVEKARVLTGDTRAHNEFDAPDRVAPERFEAFTSEFDKTGTELRFTLPPCTVAALRFR